MTAAAGPLTNDHETGCWTGPSGVWKAACAWQSKPTLDGMATVDSTGVSSVMSGGESSSSSATDALRYLRVEPLDDGDIESFFDATLNIDVNFRVQFYDKIVVVPKGGGTSGVEFKVVAK